MAEAASFFRANKERGTGAFAMNDDAHGIYFLLVGQEKDEAVKYVVEAVKQFGFMLFCCVFASPVSNLSLFCLVQGEEVGVQ